MKKWFIFIFIVLLAAGGYFLYQTTYLHAENVTQINIYKTGTQIPEESYSHEDQAAVKQIVDILNDNSFSPSESNKTNMHSDEMHNFKMDVIFNDTTKKTYEIYATLQPLEAYIIDSASKESSKLDTASAQSILSMKGFYSLYVTQVPELQFEQDTHIWTVEDSAYDWTFTLADGTQSTEKNEVYIDHSDTPVILTPDEPISVSSEKNFDNLTLKVFQNDVMVREETIENNQFLPCSFDGTCRYEISSTWSKENSMDSFGTATVVFDAYMDLPPELHMDTNTATAGDLITIRITGVNSDETVEVKQDLSKSFELVQAENEYFGFLSMNYWAKVGQYTLSMVVTHNDGTTTTYDYPVTIESKTFNKQYLTIDPNVEKSTRNEEAYSEYAKYFTPVRDSSVQKKLWDGEFIQPVEGRISTEFGEMRYVNGALTSYRHSGIDIAAPTGTPIKAPNSGEVKLAQMLILTGNTVIIDHGYGIFSVYFHMNSLNVEVGQSVSKGDIIGEVGTTGFSTGPHLHWTMSHYKTNLSPWLFMERNLLSEIE